MLGQFLFLFSKTVSAILFYICPLFIYLTWMILLLPLDLVTMHYYSPIN